MPRLNPNKGFVEPDFTLFGQSGTRVSLHLRNGQQIISKTDSRGEEGRLFLQYKKQRDFPVMPGIGIPKIVDAWMGKSFTMEYVPSVTLGTYAQDAPHLEWKSITDKLVAFLEKNLEESTTSGQLLSKQEGFSQKMAGLREKIRLPQDTAQSSTLVELEKLSGHLPFRSGRNHGDFSYENILVSKKDGGLWLVDFLDSPIDSPLIDAGRILIDCEHGWWFTGSKSSAPEQLAGTHLARKIRIMLEAQGVMDEEIRFFKLFAALRVLPYTSVPTRRSILLSIIS